MYPIEKYDFKTYEKTNSDGTKSTVVIALTTYRGRVVKGVAKCMESDTFSLEMGKKLAASRCDLKVGSKRMRRLSNKAEEASKNLENAGRHFDKIRDSLDRAVEDYLCSVNRLNTIEDAMK
jgi:hypothetical protein